MSDDSAEETEQEPARVRAWLAAHRTGLRRGLVIVASLVVAIAIEVALVAVVGPVMTVAYTLLSILGAALIPLTVMMLGNSTPNSLGSGLFILGQMTFGAGWLVQRTDGWEMCPGRNQDGQHYVLVDDAWHPVDTEHQTRLGWAPFGILFWKDDKTLADVRAEGEQSQRVSDSDRAAIEAVADTTDLDAEELLPQVSDGGGTTRGGVTEVRRTTASEERPWVIDLKQWWTRGLDRLGEIDAVSKIEEVTMRDEANKDDNTRRNTWIGSILGLVLGAATGYVVMGGGL